MNLETLKWLCTPPEKKTTCPKCGSSNIYTKYIPKHRSSTNGGIIIPESAIAKERAIPRTAKYTPPDHEFIHRHCRVCRFSWKTETSQ